MAQEDSMTNDFNALKTIWLLVSACLVFFMNAGFAMLEVGFCRTNNATNILAKNLIVFCVSALAYWMFGFGLMFGNSGSQPSVFGQAGFFFDIPFPTASEIQNNIQLIIPEFSKLQEAWAGRSFSALFFFQLTFAGTAATIVSRAVAERVRFWAFLIFSFLLVAFCYSIVGHWIWSSEGWLFNLFNFRDFAGSTVVHSVGGMAGLVGAWLLKPRDGRFGYNHQTDQFEEKERGNFTPHQLGFATLGCFILWLGWFGFNGGSAQELANVPNVITSTMIAAASGGLLTLIFSPAISGKPTLASIINGILGGLVGITASSGYVDIKSAILIGGVSGIFVIIGEKVLEFWQIDDPVGAIPVHLFCGFWGTIAVGIFSTTNSSEYSSPNNMVIQFFFQCIGWFAVMSFTFVFSLLIWLLIGNILYYFEQWTMKPENRNSNQDQDSNLSQLLGRAIKIGRQGIRVSLEDEKNGSDGTFKNL
ncbi:MAG: ammonium transporter [Gomphosphaeria aponina SAG 52.96 = DSM 107014]|uniref:Ammonium transporter n=1 Tax=Gomphosphaeria aponina SAG 52.96 = DSM 107014 TaxID=1521640 RepID=A0A941GNP4_9CHRO|nr:ammonium transporter [Gomphosphaeria aponina SAG 52.96 = DSM 107014]